MFSKSWRKWKAMLSTTTSLICASSISQTNMGNQETSLHLALVGFAELRKKLDDCQQFEEVANTEIVDARKNLVARQAFDSLNIYSSNNDNQRMEMTSKFSERFVHFGSRALAPISRSRTSVALAISAARSGMKLPSVSGDKGVSETIWSNKRKRSVSHRCRRPRPQHLQTLWEFAR
jgi:hypothetical protein